MKPIEPHLLSALLDGELPADEAQRVRRAVETDGDLRAEYERLKRLDADLVECARSLAFTPVVVLDRAAAYRPVHAVLLASGLAALRLALKALPPLASGVVEAAILAVLIGWVSTSLADMARREKQRLARVSAC
jgi:anti-sigma factor RsiW